MFIQGLDLKYPMVVEQDDNDIFANSIFINPAYPLYFGLGNDKFDGRVISLIDERLSDNIKDYIEKSPLVVTKNSFNQVFEEGYDKENLASIFIDGKYYIVPKIKFDNVTIKEDDNGILYAVTTEYKAGDNITLTKDGENSYKINSSVPNEILNRISDLENLNHLTLVDDLDNYECPVGTIVKYNGETNDKYVNGWDYKKIQSSSENITIYPNTIYIDYEGDRYYHDWKLHDSGLYQRLLDDRNGFYANTIHTLSDENELEIGDFVLDSNTELYHEIIDSYRENVYNNNIYVLDNNYLFDPNSSSEYELSGFVNYNNGKVIYAMFSSGVYYFNFLFLEEDEREDIGNGKIVFKNKKLIVCEKKHTEDYIYIPVNSPSWIQWNAQPDVSEKVSDLEHRVETNENNISALELSKQDRISEGTTHFWDNDKKLYIPQKGELVIYTDYDHDNNGKDIPNFKVGDGNTYIIDLPFAGCDYLLKKHINDKSVHHEISLSTIENECLIIS